MKYIFICLSVFFSPIIFAEDIDYIGQCNQEIIKEPINKSLLIEKCKQAGEYSEKIEDYNNASWYYLLSGETNYILKEMMRYTDSEDSALIYANIAHAFILNNDIVNSEKMYWKFVTLGGRRLVGLLTIDDINQYKEQNKEISVGILTALLQENFTDDTIKFSNSLLHEIFPLKKDSLAMGLASWVKVKERFLEKLQQAYELDSEGGSKLEEGENKKALDKFQQAQKIREEILGKEQILTADSYNNIGAAYSNINHQRSLVFYFKAMKIYKERLGEGHSGIILNYNNIGSVYDSLHNYSQAIKYYKKSLEVTKKILDINHPSLISIYNAIGESYFNSSNFRESLVYYQYALKIQESSLGEKHIDTSGSYYRMALAYYKLNEYHDALVFFKKVIAIREEYLGKDHIYMASHYSHIGSTYFEISEYHKSLDFYKKSLAIKESDKSGVFLDRDLDYRSIGMIYHKIGDYSQALVFYNKALDLREEKSDNPSDVAQIHQDIGIAYHDSGNYPQALESYNKALEIQEGLGKYDVATAGYYNSLGLSYIEMGDYEKASLFINKAIKIVKNPLYFDSATMADLNMNIGLIYHYTNDFNSSIRKNLDVLDVFNEMPNKNQIKISFVYNNIGNNYRSIGDYSNALEYYTKALVIRKKILGEDHHSTARSYHNIGVVYGLRGNYKQAIEYYYNSLEIKKKRLHDNHPDIALSYNVLSNTYGRIDDHSNAYHFSKKAFDIFIVNRNRNFFALNNQGKKKFIDANSKYINELLFRSNQHLNAFLKSNKTRKAKIQIQKTVNDWLTYKGSILDNENRLLSLAKNSPNLAVKEKYTELVAAKKIYGQLNQQVLSSAGKRELWRTKLNKQTETITQLEQTIIQLDPRFKSEVSLQAITSKGIAAGLDKNTLYIDFAKTNAGYYLFTIDHQNKVSFTAYNEIDSKAIDKAVTTFQAAMTAIAKDTNLIGKPDDKTKQTLSELYQLLFTEQLLTSIADKTSLIISPDGALRLLTFEALVNEASNEYLIESKDIRYIASGKELVRLLRQNKNLTTHQTDAVLFSNPDFGGAPSKQSADNRGRDEIYIPNTDENRTLSLLELLQPNFQALPGTKVEVEAVSKEIPHEAIKQGSDANEAYLLEVKQPSILHIATHGFFLKDIPNPMLKSGLILAGANLSLKDKRGDGIVTALDLSGLDLQGTDLVVLSACETGKVDPDNTDGISGLTKAFIQAGAKDVVMSLWSVADKETADLMTAFYKAGREDKQYAKALKDSKLALLDKGLHPYYWAAFVLSGL